MKKFLILASITSTVNAANPDTAPAKKLPPGAVQCGEGRYRYEPYQWQVTDTLGVIHPPQQRIRHVNQKQPHAALVQEMSVSDLSHASVVANPDGPPTTTHNTIKAQSAPPSYIASVCSIPDTHPLYATLLDGKNPGKILINDIDDLSIFRLTPEMGRVPNVLRNYEKYILPQLIEFVGTRSNNQNILYQQVQTYEALADFYTLKGNTRESIYMMTGIANIHGLLYQNIEAFEKLKDLMDYIQQYVPAEDLGANRTRGNVFLMMAKYLYHMERGAQQKYKTILDAYKDPCENYIIERMLKPEQKRWLSQFRYSAKGVGRREE